MTTSHSAVNEGLVKELEKKAKENRKLMVKTIHDTGELVHYGGCLSIVELLTVLYEAVLKIDPKNPKWEERDHFILSKGHASFALGVILAQRGFFDKKVLYTFDKMGTIFGTHTNIHMPGIEHPTGSLGHGLPVGIGMAAAKKLKGNTSRVFVLMGDGEIMEGTVWEAAMAGNKFKLDNLIGIVDRNKLCMEGPTEESMPLEPLEDKWKSFGWTVVRVNGHDIKSLLEAFNSIPFKKGSPSMVIADTIKGKGISFMENIVGWHAGMLDDESYQKAMKELETI